MTTRSVDDSDVVGRPAPGTCRSVTPRDAAAPDSAERRLDHQAHFQRVLMDLAVGFVNVPLDELDAAIERALATTGRFTGVDRAYLFAYDLERRTASNTHEWCGPGIEPQIQHLQGIAMDELSEWFEPHLRGEAVHVPRVSEREPGDRLRGLLEAQDVETVIAVPLIDGERCLGFVGFDAVGEGRVWADEELALLDVLAELFTNALVRTEREDAMLAARREAETARERLGLALSATRDAIFDHDVTTGRLYLSPRWWEMLGIADGPTDTDVDSVLALVHPDEVAELVDQYEATLRGDLSTLRVETRLRHRDGHHVPVLARARILRGDDGEALRVVGSNLDVTHRKRREAVARRQLELETTLATVSARFVGLDAFDAALDAALGDVGRLCGADLVFLATTDVAGHLRAPDHVWHPPWSDREGGATPSLAAVPGLEDRLRAGEAVDCTDGGAADSLTVGDPDPRGRLAVPLLVGGELVGALGLEHPDPAGAWSEADVTAIRAVAEVLAGALARARAEAELRANERKHRRTVEHLHEVVFRIDAHGRWAYLNPVWEQLTGRSVTASLGAPARDSFHPDDRDRALTAADGAIGGGAASRGELRLLTRDGQVRWVEVVVQPEFDEVGRLAGSIGSLNDVTERRENERALVEAKQAAEAASEAKTRFISTVSHELRTPLNGVIGMLELLLGRSLPPEAAGQVRAARRSASSLLTLVDDLLDIAKIEAGRLELQRQPMRPSDLVEEVSEVVAAAAADRGLELRVRVADAVPSAVLGDAGRLRQLLVNLLGNAVKFTEEGHVGLEVDLAAPVHGGVAPLAFTVTDTGSGIDPELVPTLFEAFTQADQSATRRVGGTGLGLAIVRQLTELMDGRISVDSEPGHGSTFRLELDLEVATSMPEPEPVARPSTQLPAPTPRRVLVVEDNDVNQALAQAHLEDLGCEVTVVADGEEGAAAALNGGYDLVLMDCLMPGVDGFDATRRIRAAESPDRRTPVVAVTADATFEHATVCREAGMDDVLAKPYGRGDLAAVLERHEAPRPGPGGAPSGATSDGGGGPVQVPLGDDEVVFDPRPLELLRRDVADAQLVERVVRSYADRAPELVEQLAAGAAAGDLPAVSASCHALVTSSAAVGAVLVERLARRADGGGSQHRAAEQRGLITELRSAVARTVEEHERYLDRSVVPR